MIDIQEKKKREITYKINLVLEIKYVPINKVKLFLLFRGILINK